MNSMKMDKCERDKWI